MAKEPDNEVPQSTHQNTTSNIIKVIAGPIVRKLDSKQLVLWLVTDDNIEPHCDLINSDGISEIQYTQRNITFQVGTYAFIHHLVIDFTSPLAPGSKLSYDIHFASAQPPLSLARIMPQLCYPGQTRFSVQWLPNVQQVLHGSCRKPHHVEPDALTRVDELLAECIANQTPPPSALIMSGDQVYVDDVAGPMLQAIQYTINTLGLFDEAIPGATVTSYAALASHPHGFYQRTELLPHDKLNEDVQEAFFQAKLKPIFTSVNAKNHLITAAEMFAMYFLVWSDTLWQDITFDLSHIAEEHHKTFQEEQLAIEDFASSLDKVRRALAHIPVYMIFDDHDVTDDWNLTRGWEELAYGNAFSKRIIGNALLGYWLCQGLGNAPDSYQELIDDFSPSFTPQGIQQHEALLDALFDWNHWHFSINSEPGIVVLDTRTHRWRSEDDPDKPSGLMDWERLQELKKAVTGKDSVIIVSAAPIFGVKFIEAIQRLFTFFGQALTVDAENWMAHQGTAKVLMDIFNSDNTANQFIILSGDVHYSFVYDLRLRFTKQSPTIHQITASGFKNQFPVKLIRILDKLNRLFYGHKSPLNWFTKRRKMKISTRYPNRKDKSLSLLSKSAVGVLELPADRKRPVARLLTHDHQDVEFK